MTYKVKNISNEQFVFEGISLAPGAESHELEPELYQRLLALYLNTTLAPIDKSTFASTEEEAAPVAEPEATEVLEVETSAPVVDEDAPEVPETSEAIPDAAESTPVVEENKPEGEAGPSETSGT